MLREGALQQYDTAQGIYERPANLFVAGLVGQPPMNLLAGRLRATPEGLLFKETGGTVEVRLGGLPAGKNAGTDVLLGIRPEDVRAVAAAETKKRNVAAAETKKRNVVCQGIVDHVETTGADTFYSVQTGAHLVVIRTGADAEHGGAGRRMQFDIPPERVHLFDAQTTARI